MFKKLVAKLPLILIAVAVMAFIGFVQTESPTLETYLPKNTMLCHLTGGSNNGLWNKKLHLDIKNEEDTYILVETATPFNNIEVGDIIVFRVANLDEIVCHPVVEKGDGVLRTKGFNNPAEDSCIVRLDNYRGRVVQISEDKSGPWKKVERL